MALIFKLKRKRSVSKMNKMAAMKAKILECRNLSQTQVSNFFPGNCSKGIVTTFRSTLMSVQQKGRESENNRTEINFVFFKLFKICIVSKT